MKNIALIRKAALLFAGALFFNFACSRIGSAQIPEPPEAGWLLPVTLSDANTAVHFAVDSTWHMIHGKTSGLAGELHLADPADPMSIRGTVKIPVAKFDTDNSSRDSRMREVLNEPKYGSVEFTLESVTGTCRPEDLKEGQSCTAKASGVLLIADHKEPVSIDFSITRNTAGFLAGGSAQFSWRLFPIEDPSILIAKLHDDVTVEFQVITAAR